MGTPEELAVSTPPPDGSGGAAEPRLALWFARHRGQLRGAILVLATLLSLLGTVGQFYLIDATQKIADAREQEMRDIEARTETLRTAQSAYFNAQVQANMLFALNPADRSINKGIVGDLYQLAIFDRAFPFRSILGELAIAGAIQFASVNADYNRLREAAMSDFGYDSFTAVGNFEHEILDQALALHGSLQERFFVAQEDKAKAAAEADRRRALLLAITGLATCLFLLANLMGTRD
jgi:hypothetical protein